MRFGLIFLSFLLTGVLVFAQEQANDAVDEAAQDNSPAVAPAVKKPTAEQTVPNPIVDVALAAKTDETEAPAPEEKAADAAAKTEETEPPASEEKATDPAAKTEEIQAPAPEEKATDAAPEAKTEEEEPPASEEKATDAAPAAKTEEIEAPAPKEKDADPAAKTEEIEKPTASEDKATGQEVAVEKVEEKAPIEEGSPDAAADAVEKVEEKAPTEEGSADAVEKVEEKAKVEEGSPDEAAIAVETAEEKDETAPDPTPAEVPSDAPAVKNPKAEKAVPVVDVQLAAKTDEVEAPAPEKDAAGDVAIKKAEEKAPLEEELPDKDAAETAAVGEEIKTADNKEDAASPEKEAASGEDGGEEAPIPPAEDVETPSQEASVNATDTDDGGGEAPISPAEGGDTPSEEASVNATAETESTGTQSPLQKAIFGNETCSAHGKCECDSGYSGKNCEKAINFCHKKFDGILAPTGKASLAEACKPHGKCVSETGKGALCECNKGWSGDFCNNPDENHSITRRCLYRRARSPKPINMDKSIQTGCRGTKPKQFCVPDNLNCLMDYPKQNCSYPIGWCVQREFSLVQLMTKLSKPENKKDFEKILKR